MNILIDARLLGRGDRSGVGEYSSELIKELIRDNYKTNFKILYNGFNFPPPPIFWTERKNVKVLNFNIPNKFFNLSSRFFNFPNLQKIVSPDVLFSPHLSPLSLKNTPKVLTIHDLSFIRYPEFFSKSQRLWHYLQNARRQINESVAIIADSEFTKSDLVDLFKIRPDKISIVYPGLNSSFKVLSFEKELKNLFSFQKKYRLENPYLLYLGSFEPRKNIPAAIRAFNEIKKDSRFSDLELVAAGGAGWLSKNIYRAISLSPFSSAIKIIRDLIPEEKVFLYNKARAFVFPSFFEGFGFPPLEAQSCGVPVIASNRSSLPEILGDSALLVDPWKISELTDALKEVLLNNSLASELKKRGLENVRKFSWEKSASEILNIFYSICS